jgi:ABC-2 type transport system permease protein
MKLFSLVENEVIKMIFKKRLFLIFGILLVLITLFSYGEKYTIDKNKEQLSKRIGITEKYDWKKLTEQQIISTKNRLDNPYIPETEKATLKVRIEQLQYYIDKGINPIDSSAAKFSSSFMEEAIFMFLPLLIVMLAADMVSGEASNGTIKLLLTRNVPRWKILLSKYLALIIMEIIVLVFAIILSTIISGIFFGYGGWTEPVSAGFKVIKGKLDATNVINVPQWQYTIMVYALAYFIALVIGSISFMVSVLVKSTAASIGVMMSTLVGGSILSYFIADWKFTRYLFMVNLRLTDYLSGSVTPVEGINMTFSIVVLIAWAIGALAVSFIWFTKQDILV